MRAAESPIDGRASRPAPCSQCGSHEATRVCARHGYSYVRCNTCTLVRVSPQLTQHAIDEIYRSHYADKSGSVARPGRGLQPGQQRIMDTLSRLAGARGHLLDVGCFQGQLLWAARELGWKVTGTEISEAAATYARREWRLDVRVGRLEELALPADGFDAVALVDVIEHVPDPRRTLAEVHRILRPGGALYAWTPNFDSLTRRVARKRWGAVLFPWHLYYFTPRTLVRMVEATGFTPAGLATRNWLLDFRDRYAALQKGAPLGIPPKLVRRTRQWIDFGSQPFFACTDRWRWHLGAQIELFATKNRSQP